MKFNYVAVCPLHRRFDLVLAGDDVSNKKPHPEIYNTAAQVSADYLTGNAHT